LVSSARHVYSRNALSPCQRLSAFDVPADATFDTLLTLVQDRIDDVRADHDSVLILTDVVGATPANVAQHLAHPGSVSVLTGVNLAMLLRALCYSDKSLAEVESKALEGAVRGIQALGAGPASADPTPPKPRESTKT
jgi:PTS system ascorbate-specific IIA component